MTGPLNFDFSVFRQSSDSAAKDEPVPPSLLDPELLKKVSTGEKTPVDTAAALINTLDEGPTFEEMMGLRAPSDATDVLPTQQFARERDEIPRAERLKREQERYLRSPEKAAEDLQIKDTISPAPTGLAKLRQNLGSMRFFTDRNLVEFDMGNSSGFHVGTPFAHPIETAKSLVMGVPQFASDLIKKPLWLAVDQIQDNKFLLPEEREAYTREAVAAYASLLIGGATGAAAGEMYVGRDILKTGVKSAIEKGLKDEVTQYELQQIAGTAARAHALEATLPGKIGQGIVTGASGGASYGAIAGRTPEERRNMMATYALMAIPAGVAYEALHSRFRDPTQLGYHEASAAQAFELSYLRQTQEAAKQSAHNAANSFLQLRDANDLAEAAHQANAEGSTIVQGVTNYRPDGTEIVHQRPDGKLDIVFGGVPNIPEPPPAADVPEKVTPDFTPEQLDDIISYAKTGKDRVGAAMDRSLLKKLGANMYKSGISSVIIKEGLQNAVDAIRPTGDKGSVRIDYDDTKGTFQIQDTGVGMTPEVAANQFMDVGGSKKPGGASGGYGLAKVGLLSNAEHFKMVTVADTPEGRKMTVIEGSSDDWVNGTLQYRVEDAPDDQTGTDLYIQVPPELAKRDENEARSFLRKAFVYNRGPASRLTTDTYIGNVKREPVNEDVDTIDTDAAEVSISHAEQTHELGQYDRLNVEVLNNGLYQFTMEVPAKGVVPHFIVVDVKPKVGVDSEEYPFTTSREELKGDVAKAVKQYIGGLALAAAKKDALQLIGRLQNAPEIFGTRNSDGRPLRVVDTSGQAGDELTAKIAGSRSVREISQTHAAAFDALAVLLEPFANQITAETYGLKTFMTGEFGGLGIGAKYLGLNINKSGLQNVAQAAQVPVPEMSGNIILYNPFVTWEETLAIRRNDREGISRAFSIAEHMADQSIGTLVHELVHEAARGHDESFSGALTRAIGRVSEHGADIRAMVLRMWENIIQNDETYNEFVNLHSELHSAWEIHKDDKFKGISDKQQADANAGSPDYSTPPGNLIQPSAGNPPVSGGTGTGPSSVVPAGGTGSGSVGSGSPTDFSTLEARRLHAQATFEVGGYFPNEIVSFLGKDYNYVQPVLGSDGKLQAHIIQGADGHKFEVQWDQLRHGPDMAVNSFLFDKPAARRALVDDFEKSMNKIYGDKFPDKPFADVVAQYAHNKNLPTAMVNPLIRFLSDEYGKRMRDQHLSADEKATYMRISREIASYQKEHVNDLVDLATSNGMYIERQNGALIIRESDTGAYLELAHSPEEAINFIQNVVADRRADLTPPGGPPDGTNRALMPVPPPPGGPQTSAWTPRANGWFGELRDVFNVSKLGTHFTGMRQVMISLDNQLGTKFFENLYQPLQEAHLRKYAAMHGDLTRAAATARMLKGLTVDQGEQITNAIETMTPEELVKPGGLMKRGYTPKEIAGANWFIKNQIDIRKAFQYYRALKNLERKPQFFRSSEPDKIEAVHKLQASLNVDAAHIEAARVMGAVLAKNKPGELSLYAMVRLAEATMDGHLSRQDFIDKHFPPADTEAGRKMRMGVEEVSSHFKDLAKTFDIPEEQRLGGYFAHLRNYNNDEIITPDRGEAPIFTSELLRTGEMSEYDRDPINVLVRYMNLGFGNKFTKDALNDAYDYLAKTTARMTDSEHGAYVERLLKENYINELRGIPHASSSFAEKILNGVLDRLGVKSDVSVRRDLVNTFLSLSSSATIGFRPMQGIRDFQNFSSIYYSRFGSRRLGDLYSIMARVTPQELVQAGILKQANRGEGSTEALAREGVIPTLAPISVLTPQERLQNTLASRTGPYRQFIQQTADLGIKWGLQHNVYQWAHAASYLETYTRALDELNKMAQGTYGPEGKTKAYDRLFLNSYDPPVAAYFDDLVTKGKFQDAADFLGRATAFETVSVFGLANHPAGWGTNSGRLFGQFGNWPVWARTTFARMISRGTKAEKTRVAVRFAATQGALAATSAALGLNLNSWYLPSAAPVVSAAMHLGVAAQAYDDEQTKAIQQAAASIILGVPGSMLFRGGPAVSFAQSAIQASQGYPRAEQEAADALVQAPLLLTPGSYLIRDIYEGSEMAANGDNPLSAWLRAFGVRSTPDESLLNPSGIVTDQER